MQRIFSVADGDAKKRGHLRKRISVPKSCYRVAIRAKTYGIKERHVTWFPVISANSEDEASAKAMEIFSDLIRGDIRVLYVTYRHDVAFMHPINNAFDDD